VGDADGLEELGAGRVVVAAEEEELGEDLGRERRVVRPRPRRGRRAVTADAADLALLVLVVVPTDPARVLPLPLPHLRRRRRSRRKGDWPCGLSSRLEQTKRNEAAVPFPEEEGGAGDGLGRLGRGKRRGEGRRRHATREAGQTQSTVAVDKSESRWPAGDPGSEHPDAPPEQKRYGTCPHTCK
jgi:hypothetical protein